MTHLNVVFNFDSTLTSIEGPVELARHMRVKGVEELTELAMSGQESFSQVFAKRFTIYKPGIADLRWLGKQYLAYLTSGAHELTTKLTARGHRLFIVSAGYRLAILGVAHKLGIPSLQVCAVDIDFDDQGRYKAYDEGNILTTDDGLAIVLAEIAKLGPTVYLGDSVRDMDALTVADLVIGYGGARYRPQVEQRAHHYIKQPSLLPALRMIDHFATTVSSPESGRKAS